MRPGRSQPPGARKSSSIRQKRTCVLIYWWHSANRHRIDVSPIRHELDTLMAETETWLSERLKMLAARIGEPVSITLHVLPDDDLQLDLETRSGRHGIAYGTSLSQMLTEAEEALFQIDEVLQELGVVF